MTERAALEPLDAMVRAEIEVAARAVATATAIVPLALLDVLAALSQNVRMIRRIAEIYGAHAGFFGSWRLLRMVAAHLLATGLVAVGDDMMGSVAGGHVLARLSKRFGEGVMNGALTARVGVAAMDVCRPLPFAALPRPKVSNLVGRALAGLFQRDGAGPEAGLTALPRSARVLRPRAEPAEEDARGLRDRHRRGGGPRRHRPAEPARRRSTP